MIKSILVIIEIPQSDAGKERGLGHRIQQRCAEGILKNIYFLRIKTIKGNNQNELTSFTWREDNTYPLPSTVLFTHSISLSPHKTQRVGQHHSHFMGVKYSYLEM